MKSKEKTIISVSNSFFYFYQTTTPWKLFLLSLLLFLHSETEVLQNQKAINEDEPLYDDCSFEFLQSSIHQQDHKP